MPKLFIVVFQAPDGARQGVISFQADTKEECIAYLSTLDRKHFHYSFIYTQA